MSRWRLVRTVAIYAAGIVTETAYVLALAAAVIVIVAIVLAIS